ncbi:transcription activator effector-binding protein [Winogradskyella sp. PC-19]|uniref:SRPBCC family protein n=1 Tax=unclassified Winogradskyella TaxID=2615021 RepID=UPI000B3D0672|nr:MULTISPECIES: SRPBCC family protein [unclassified Winogradskyella]ARV09049.1 transcription activator effector-binding protein [Winogradskyella sp. PC-19]
MKALKYILFLLLILAIGLAIYIAVQPNSFEVERSRTIDAPAQVVYNNVIDFKNWEAWNSWKDEDPTIVMTMSDKTDGVGGSYSWTDEDGIGTMKTTDAVTNTSITQEMQFGDFPKSDVKWSFTPNEDGSTKVTWNISGKDLPFGFKAFATLMGGMEKQIGPHYERGLEMLDDVIMQDMKRYSIKVEGLTEHSGGFYLYNTTSCKMGDFKQKMQEMLPKVGGYAISNNIRMAGAPFVIYHKWDEANDAVMFSCAIPTSSKITTTESEILTGQLQSFKAVKTILYGDYENLKEAWEKTMTYVEDNNLESPIDAITLESYLTDPTSQPNPADWITEIYIEVK